MGCPTHETFKIGLMKVGLTIAFIGTDGSGKSTIIDHVVPWLNSININGVHYEHLRPNWLPPLRALKGSSTSDKTENMFVGPTQYSISIFLRKKEEQDDGILIKSLKS